MEETLNKIISRAKKKIQHLDTERILSYTVDSDDKIISGRTVSKKSLSGSAYLNTVKLSDMITGPKVEKVVLVHNHPRSTMKASEDDNEVTEYVHKVCENNGCSFYDHIIIMKNNDDVYSYRRTGKMEGA